MGALMKLQVRDDQKHVVASNLFSIASQILEMSMRVSGICFHDETARKLYAGLGFVETGEIVEQEALAFLKLRAWGACRPFESNGKIPPL
jgi:hypothetical protein